MTLENLLRIGQLKRHEAHAEEIERLVESARRALADARVRDISPETRFDAAYRTILQAALAALLANGYRPDTNRPGHHMTVLQSLPKTIGLEADRVALLDALRRKRNLTDYLGENIDRSTVEECIREAARVLSDVTSWLAAKVSDDPGS